MPPRNRVQDVLLSVMQERPMQADNLRTWANRCKSEPRVVGAALARMARATEHTGVERVVSGVYRFNPYAIATTPPAPAEAPEAPPAPGPAPVPADTMPEAPTFPQPGTLLEVVMVDHRDARILLRCEAGQLWFATRA